MFDCEDAAASMQLEESTISSKERLVVSGSAHNQVFGVANKMHICFIACVS